MSDKVLSIPYSFSKSSGIVVTSNEENEVKVSVLADANSLALAEISRVFQKPLHVSQISQQEFERLLEIHFGGGNAGAATVALDIAHEVDLSKLLQEIPKVEDLLDSQNDAPVVRLINALLTQALREQASDIHIEPFESRSSVRLRIDGILRELLEPPQALHAAIISRIKIMANLDIAEKRLPQDGRIAFRLGGKQIDVRVSTIPAGHGERVVLRLLEKDRDRLNLNDLGMSEEMLGLLDRLIQQPHGIILITGPTGSGKTTTLYSALSRIDSSSLNVMTVEDPIEYDLDGVSQTQVNYKIDMTFARALRTILRQDPDVIMIGEIRDLETAEIAIQASLTGHLVFATLHTNDAISAINRLIDMGVESYLLASSLIGIEAQRLVRKLCPECKTPVTFKDRTTEKLNSDQFKQFKPIGCNSCNQTGYKGRTGIYELVVINDSLRQLIHDRASEKDLRSLAEESGAVFLRSDGDRWINSGVSSLEEILRVTRN